jgi:rod shape-determining protein MreD
MGIYLKYFLIIAVLILVQKTVIWLIAITTYQITPDIVLIGIVYIGIKQGKISGSITGFITGLILDLLSFSFFGLLALSKSVAGFFTGFFNIENKYDRYLNSYTFMLIVLFASLINNILYFWIYFQGTSLTFLDLLFRYILPSSLYTALLSSVVVLFNKRRPAID